MAAGGCLGLGEPRSGKSKKICSPTRISIQNPDDPSDLDITAARDDDDDDDDVETTEPSLVFTDVFCGRECTALLTQDGELFVAGERTLT